MKRVLLGLVALAGCEPVQPSEQYGFVARLGHVPMRQFYIDREFDNFPLHRGSVMPLPGGKADIRHDWLSGTGTAVLDSSNRLISYSGARTTYKVEVERLAVLPDVKGIGARFAALEATDGGMKQMSVRDTVRATIGSTAFVIDYSRPLVRGRTLLGDVIAYDQVWRTGANAATQFTASSPIAVAGLAIPAGTYTLWTVPRVNAVDLIVNKQTGQWGTGYNPAHNLGRVPMASETVSTVTEKFTISIVPIDSRRGTLVMAWGSFRWTAPVSQENGTGR